MTIQIIKLNLDPGLFDTEKINELSAKTNNLVEKLSEIGYFLMTKITLAFWIFPKVIISYFVYLTTDSGTKPF